MKLAMKFANLLCVLVAGITFGLVAQGQAGPPLKIKHTQSPLHATAVAHAKADAAHAQADAAPTTPAPDKAEPTGSRRDPFTALISERKAATGPSNLPPGKGGLVISTVRVDGTVRSGNEMIAVVSNPDEHVYFVREGDHLYDGDVEKIGIDGVTFKEDSKDAFGKTVERIVTKRIYASAGEQQ